MAKWEYKIVVGDARKVEKQLNELAEDGWEPINISITWAGCAALVRRPKGN